MNYAIVAAIVTAILLIARHLMARARVDQIINSLPVDDKKAKVFQTELERLTQEIKDADIAYSNAKRNSQQPNKPGK